MKNYCKKLLSVGGNALVRKAPAFNQTISDLAGNLREELQNFLFQKNGFYCFESALHIFPSSSYENVISLEQWNSQELWRKHYGLLAEKCLFFAEDIFGGQFCILEDKICTFDVETGDIEVIANDLESWAKSILDEYSYLTGFPLAHEWQKEHGAIPANTRLLPKIPFVCGGKFDIDNLYLLDSVKGMILRADLARQINNLTDGTMIKFKIVD